MNDAVGSKKAHLPVSRIHTIMKSSSDVEIVGKDSSVLMCKATELFIKQLSLEAFNVAKNIHKIDYKHIAEIVHTDEKYNFLRDIMPKKITVAEYKKIMARKHGIEDEIKKEDDRCSDSSDEEDDSSSDSDESSASA